MIRWIVLFILVLQTACFSSLVINEIKPMDVIKQAQFTSIVVFPFNARSINNKKLNYLAVSSILQRNIVGAFQDRTPINPVESSVVSLENGVQIKTIKGDSSVNDYNQREENGTKDIDPVGSRLAQVHLTGTIDEYYPAKKINNSYIKITFQLIDSRTHMIYWTSTLSGCYTFVVNALVDSIEKKEYTGPSIKDEKEYGWANPKTNRMHTYGIGIDVHSLVPLGQLKKSIRPAAQIEGVLYFSHPFLLPIHNRFSAGWSSHITATNDGSDYYFIPVQLSFLYDIPKIEVPNFFVSARADIGCQYQLIRFSRVIDQKDDINAIGLRSALGIDIRYEFPSLILRGKKMFFYWPKTAIHLGYLIDLVQFKDSSNRYKFAPCSDLSLGVKFFL